jgi:hypothetical protein
VNRIPGGKIAHSANGGACWKSLNTPFVSAVERSINAGSYTNERGLPVPITTEDETSITGVTSMRMDRNRIEGQMEMEMT